MEESINADFDKTSNLDKSASDFLWLRTILVPAAWSTLVYVWLLKLLLHVILENHFSFVHLFTNDAVLKTFTFSSALLVHLQFILLY